MMEARDVYEAYDRAIWHATDGGCAPGRLLAQIKASFGLGDSAFDVMALDRLWRCIGLARCEITIDGPRFDIVSRHQGKGWPAWVMPVVTAPAFGGGETEYEDLLAFADDGPHAGKVWQLNGNVAAIGLDRPDGERTLRIFTQPKRWVDYWVRLCRDAYPTLREHTYPGPETVAALVLQPNRVRWKPRIEVVGVVPATIEDLLFPDSPELRALVEKEMRLPPLKLPRLRAAKGKPEAEVRHGAPSDAA